MQEKTTDDLQKFRWRLKQATERRGLSQADVARQMNSTAPRVGNWYQGRNKPKPAERPILAALLGVDQDWLINGIGEPTVKDSYLQNESVLTATDEAQANYGGNSATLEKEVRLNFSRLLAAAKGDVARLGWILEQIRLHLNQPVHWNVNPRYDKLDPAARKLVRERERLMPKDKPSTQRSA